MRWTKEERAFAVEVYLSNGRSVVVTQRAFRNRFNIHPTGPVPGRQSIVMWVDAFRETGSVAKKRPGGQRTSRTPENVERVRLSFLRSPRGSARKLASAMGISDRTVRRILHDELKFHPYKPETNATSTSQTSCPQASTSFTNALPISETDIKIEVEEEKLFDPSSREYIEYPNIAKKARIENVNVPTEIWPVKQEVEDATEDQASVEGIEVYKAEPGDDEADVAEYVSVDQIKMDMGDEFVE